MKAATNRRTFMKGGLAAAGAGLLSNSSFALADDNDKNDPDHEAA